MLALFESLGGWELALVGVAALLLFGKDLPRVAAEAGAQLTKLRRSLDSTWRETGLEKEVRQIRDALPRDLSLGDVARTAREKLAVRLEEDAQGAPATPAQPPIPPPASDEAIARATTGTVPRAPQDYARAAAAESTPVAPPAEPSPAVAESSPVGPVAQTGPLSQPANPEPSADAASAGEPPDARREPSQPA